MNAQKIRQITSIEMYRVRACMRYGAQRRKLGVPVEWGEGGGSRKHSDQKSKQAWKMVPHSTETIQNIKHTLWYAWPGANACADVPLRRPDMLCVGPNTHTKVGRRSRVTGDALMGPHMPHTVTLVPLVLEWHHIGGRHGWLKIDQLVR